MAKVIKYGLSLLLLIITGISDAQNYEQDMQKIRDGYKNKYHSFRMKFMFFPYDSLATIADSMKGQCRMEGNEYYYKVNDQHNEYEYLKNEKYYMVVDHGNKVVAVNSSSKARPELWNLNKLDSMLNIHAANISYKNIDKNTGEYDITFPQSKSWNRLHLTFDKKAYTLSCIYMFSDERGKINGQGYAKPRIGIYYYDYKAESLDKKIFSEEKYFHKDGDKTVLANDYKGYRLLNYLKSKN